MGGYHYTIILHPDTEQGVYGVTVPVLPGCVTQGNSIEDAISMAKEAISLHIEGMLADGEPVPQESEHPQALTISVAAPADVATSAASV